MVRTSSSRGLRHRPTPRRFAIGTIPDRPVALRNPALPALRRTRLSSPSAYEDVSNLLPTVPTDSWLAMEPQIVTGTRDGLAPAPCASAEKRV